MHLIGRWQQVHRYISHLNHYDGPFMIDHKYQTMNPVRDERWWKSKEGIWVPVVSGGLGNRWQGAEESGSVAGYSLLNNGTITWQTRSLDSAYVAGTSGDAAAWSFIPTEDVTLNTVYYLIDSYGGTAANVNDLTVELRADSSNVPDVSGAATESFVSNPTSFLDRWITVSGFTTALTAGTRYWIVIGDLDGNATDFARLSVTFSAAEDVDFLKSSSWITPADSTNGFSTVSSRFAQTPAIILAFSDGSVMGNHPWTIRSTITSDTNQKGMFFGGGFGNGNARIVGVQFMSNDQNVNWESVRIWEGTSGPSGTPFATSVFMFQPGANNSGYSGGVFSGTHSGNGYPKLTPSTDYRIVMQPTVADALFNVIMGATDNATLRSAAPGKGNWYQTVESGGAWVDNVSAFVNFGVLFDDWLPDEATSIPRVGRVFPVVP